MKNLKINYYFTDFFSGLLLIFLPLYLRSNLGFNELQIGVIYFFGGISAVISSIVNGYIAQKIIKKKRVLNIGLFFTLFGSIILLTSTSFKMIIIGYIFLFYIRSLLYIIGDELTISYVKLYPNFNFGKIRSFGSLGWGSNFLISSLIFIFFPTKIIFLLLIVVCILLINSFYLPTIYEIENHPLKINDILLLFKYKNFMLFLLITSLMWSTVNNMQMFIEFALQDNNGSIFLFAFFNVCILILDIMFMRKSTALLKKFGGKKYFLFFMSVMFLKFLLLAIHPTTIIIYICVFFDPLFFGLMIPFNSLFTKFEIPDSLSTIALTLVTTLSTILVSIMSIVYGAVYHILGYQSVFIIMVLTMGVALIAGLKLNYNKIDNN